MLARECRLCACASFTSAPTNFSQVACEVRRDRQFTHGMAGARPAGLRNRTTQSKSSRARCMTITTVRSSASETSPWIGDLPRKSAIFGNRQKDR